MGSTDVPEELASTAGTEEIFKSILKILICKLNLVKSTQHLNYNNDGIFI
jgi:hypothetical protein